MKHLKYLLFPTILFSLLLIGCEKDPEEEEEEPKITCSASCSSMSWEIVDESGPSTRMDDCTRNYQGNNYIETCTGTITYTNSGNSYTYKAIYDWIDCEISVTVNGLGSCSDNALKSASCNCNGTISDNPDVVVFRENVNE